MATTQPAGKQHALLEQGTDGLSVELLSHRIERCKGNPKPAQCCFGIADRLKQFLLGGNNVCVACQTERGCEDKECCCD